MRASYGWLKSLVPGLTASPADVAERLTRAGIAVDTTHEHGAAAAVCLVAEVASIRPHPTKSGLRLVTVRHGAGEQEVVCGAPNVPEPGGLVVLAPLGAHLPAKGVTIERRTIAGVASEGMLCSEAELGLSEAGEGILVLPKGAAKPGQKLAEVFPEAHDFVYEIDLTPNRPDCLGHLGLAREISALYNLPFVLPEHGVAPASAETMAALGVAVEVRDAARCPHYGAALVRGVTVAPSPLGTQWRLAALGVRAISNVVDVTNLLMLLWGHPMHAFDLAHVRKKKIVVRLAEAGERIRTLDGVDRELVADDLLICDGEGPVALAGVMGGADSEIKASTRDVLFEVAYFDPRSVRRTARRHGMHTESSHRFERGVDRGDVARVLAHATSLTASLSPGARAAADVIHAAAPAPAPARVALRRSRMDALLGVAVPWADACAVLERLGFAKDADGAGDAATFAVPTHRPDVTREVDLVEEVIRTHGMDHVPAELPAIHPTRPVGGSEERARRARAAAVELGLSEAVTYAFTSTAGLEALGAPKPSVVLKNPIVDHHQVMRTSLLPGLLAAVKNAKNHGVRDATLFTVGSVYLASNPGALPAEPLWLAALLAGDRPAYLTKPSAYDAWDATGLAVALVERLAGRAPTIQRESFPHLHPRGSAGLYLDGVRVGRAGPLHPDVRDFFEVTEAAVVVEIDLEKVGEPRLPAYRALPRFPASARDVALVVHDDVPAGDVLGVVREAAGPLAEDVAIFDRFVGGAIPPEHASLAFRVVYRAPDRTLTDAEVDAAHAKVVAAAEARFSATLRR
jgi:phenylalanyl-tRNA synthetase beta chain